MSPEQNFDLFYHNCISRLSSFEIWPGYYKRRYEEFKKLYSFFPKKEFDKTLEIGCGIGYQSGFLSCISKHVVASDIDLGDMVKHSRGLAITREFIEQNKLGNVEVVNANAQDLQFEDEQFDLVYCSYSFQYIPDKAKALKEINRVLKKGGCFFCILPTTSGRLSTIPPYYKAGVKKLFTLFQGKATTGNGAGQQKTNANETVARKTTRLLPPPDDDSNSFIKELLTYSTAAWRKLFKNNGHRVVAEEHLKFSSLSKTEAGFLERAWEKFTAEGIVLMTKK